MNDIRSDIAFGCAMNVAVINEIQDSEVFKQACIDVPKKFGVNNQGADVSWPFFNASWGAYMMYCLFVVNKELYNLPVNDEFFTSLVDRNAMKDFNIFKERESFSDNPKYHFNCFRNSISHANFSISEKVRFWDSQPRKPNTIDRHWDVEISFEELFDFFRLVNLSNLVLRDEINKGIRNHDGTKF